MVTLWIKTGNNTIRPAKPSPYIRKVLKAGQHYEETGDIIPLKCAVAAAQEYLSRVIQSPGEVQAGLSRDPRT